MYMCCAGWIAKEMSSMLALEVSATLTRERDRTQALQSTKLGPRRRSPVRFNRSGIDAVLAGRMRCYWRLDISLSRWRSNLGLEAKCCAERSPCGSALPGD